MSGCVGRGLSALLCPGAYNAVKDGFVYIIQIIAENKGAPLNLKFPEIYF